MKRILSVLHQVAGRTLDVYIFLLALSALLPVLAAVVAQRVVDAILIRETWYMILGLIGIETLIIVARVCIDQVIAYISEKLRFTLIQGIQIRNAQQSASLDIEFYEDKGIKYFIKNPEKFRDKRVVIAGGGDSALDWTIELVALGSQITLVHRRSSFRGAPDSVDKVMELVSHGKVKLITDASVVEVIGNDVLQSVVIEVPEGKVTQEADFFIPLFGLTPKLGPIADWGLGLDKNAIEVNPYDCSTNVDGIFAIGDINTYPGKLKLILCGFHEATMMCQAAFRYIYPEQKLSFKYTTVTGIDGF